MAARPDGVFRAEWLEFERDPGPLVFLLGCQRSGTTLLHLQLAQTGAFRYLSASEVWSADRLVHDARYGLTGTERERFAELLRGCGTDRGIDSIPAGPDTPEEYGLVIGNAAGGTIRYEQADTTPETLPTLRELLAKKALLEGRARPMLLKSPPDSPWGVVCLEEAFPEARYILIHRHPLLTLQSHVRAWREAVLRRNGYLALIDRGYHALFEDAGRRMKMGMFLHSGAGVEWLAECILRACLGFLPMEARLGQKLATIRYEDLCADQGAAFAKMSVFLGMPLPVPEEEPAPRAARISDEVRRVWEKRVAEFAPYLEHCGYGAEAGCG